LSALSEEFSSAPSKWVWEPANDAFGQGGASRSRWRPWARWRMAGRPAPPSAGRATPGKSPRVGWRASARAVRRTSPSTEAATCTCASRTRAGSGPLRRSSRPTSWDSGRISGTSTGPSTPMTRTWSRGCFLTAQRPASGATGPTRSTSSTRAGARRRGPTGTGRTIPRRGRPSERCRTRSRSAGPRFPRRASRGPRPASPARCLPACRRWAATTASSGRGRTCRRTRR